MAEKQKSFGERYMVRPGSPLDLSKCDPRAANGFADKDSAKAETAKDAEAIDALQDRLYAEGKRSLLVILQGIDCSGKDGTVRAVFNSCGPIGVKVQPFKSPTVDELAQDYLWRVHKVCPAKGYIGIFNRSHYEDVLVVKVRKFASEEAIERRYGEINAFEKLLADNGTKILKFMLNISKEEQAKRLKERIEMPEKRWKFNPADLEDRALWVQYMKACEVAVCARNAGAVVETVQQLQAAGVKAHGSALDVANRAALEGFVGEAAAALGGLDILVCNASALVDGAGEQAFRDAFEVDLLHTRNACEVALPYLEASGSGAIIAISSISGSEDYGFGSAAYGTMKAALLFYMKSLARHVASKGIRANVVSPGTTFFNGGVWDEVKQNDPASFARALADNPMGRMARPEEIADAAVFLASARASFISGVNLAVDGTLTMRVQN